MKKSQTIEELDEGSVNTLGKAATVGFLTFLSMTSPALAANSTKVDRPELFNALRQVESGGQPNEGRDAVGDNGKALGPYQLHYIYWKDATDFDKSIGGKYEDVKDKAYAEKVIKAYWKKYAPKDATDEDLARIHNGGPKGNKKTATDGYWKKVKSKLKPRTA